MKNDKSYSLGNMHGYLRVAEVGLNTVILHHADMRLEHHSLLTDDEVNKLKDAIDILKEAQKRD